jgi:outer membrane protein assembly factor BamB
MHSSPNHRFIVFVFLTLAIPLRFTAQDDSGWHISPVEMNVRVGEPRPLQLLDARGREFHTDEWSVDDTNLADITQDDGRVVLYPKAPGVVNVAALLDGTMQTRKITIWPQQSKFKGVRWSVPPIGRETGTLQAVPSDTGPDLFSLDESAQATYVRGFSHDGLQLWLSSLPQSGGKVDFICGDNLGGAILAAVRSDSYTMYVVSKDGKLLWHRRFEGIRKGHALNYNNMLHVLNQAVDGTWATIIALDGATGVEQFNLKIPVSRESEVNIARVGDKIICAPGISVSHALRVLTSGLFVNTDGDAYAAFTENDWTVGTDKCTAGSVVDPQKVYFSRDDKLLLWRIHSDGSQKTTIVDASKQERSSFAVPVSVKSPTGDIIPDGFGGVLLSVRWSSADITQKVRGLSDEFVYRITEDGELAYRFPLPKYAGTLHDEMVLGEKNLGFATRGGTLIAFNVEDGSEVWHWDSGVPEIKINMATAGGGCAVDTPEGLVLVEEGIKKGVVAPSGSQMYTPGEYIHTAH